MEALTAMGDRRLPGAASMDIRELTASIEQEYGVSYDEIWQTCYDKYGRSHERLENWLPADFDAVIVDGGVVVPRPTEGREGKVECAPSVNEMMAQDKLVLQSYGRPYDQAGRPTGTYYQYPKTAPLPEWS